MGYCCYSNPWIPILKSPALGHKSSRAARPLSHHDPQQPSSPPSTSPALLLSSSFGSSVNSLTHCLLSLSLRCRAPISGRRLHHCRLSVLIAVGHRSFLLPSSPSANPLSITAPSLGRSPIALISPLCRPPLSSSSATLAPDGHVASPSSHRSRPLPLSPAWLLLLTSSPLSSPVSHPLPSALNSAKPLLP